MEQYIPKSALVAKINELLNLEEEVSYFDKNSFNSGRWKGLIIAKAIIDTLEVKEVDLDKETTHYLLSEHRSPLNEIMHKAEMQYHKDIENAFKAGFKLGMAVSKAQKGKKI